MRSIDAIRAALQDEIERDDIGLRTMEAKCGLSLATISRFLRVGTLEHRNVEILDCYLSGKKAPKRKQVSSRRMQVSGKTFLITIEELS